MNDNLIVRGAHPSMLSAMPERANNVSSSMRSQNPALQRWAMVGPDFVRPDPMLPETTFQGDQPISETRLPPPTDPTWWRAVPDPALNGFAQRIADENPHLPTATMRRDAGRFLV